jgi:hypothetical protein
VIFEVFEIVEGVENALGTFAEVGGGAHAIEEQREVRPAFFDGEFMSGRIEPDVRDPAGVQLFEERFEPVRMFVINGDG